MCSKVNSQQAPVQWLREITKTKLSQAEPSRALEKDQEKFRNALMNQFSAKGRIVLMDNRTFFGNWE